MIRHSRSAECSFHTFLQVPVRQASAPPHLQLSDTSKEGTGPQETLEPENLPLSPSPHKPLFTVPSEKVAGGRWDPKCGQPARPPLLTPPLCP